MNNTTASLPAHFTAHANTTIGYPTILLSLLVVYPLICSYLRFSRRDALVRKHGYTTRESMGKMTDDEAQVILGELGDLEFPRVYSTSLQFALFKTYGIPTISKLLLDTRQLGAAENASKRYADTEALILEFMSHPPTSPRTLKAIARMNFIHSSYQKAGKISNADMLYTLSVFVTEPIAWIERLEWRSMNQLEICASGTFWKSMGDAMLIDYGLLGKKEWTDGIEFYQDIKKWAQQYERECMVPAKSNHLVANETAALLLFHVPKSYKAAGLKVVAALMPEILRKAMMYDTPPAGYFTFVKAVFGLRKFLLRYLSLPRPGFMRVNRSSEVDPKTGLVNSTYYQAHPFYVKPTLLNRYGPEAWITWALGGDLPGDKGTAFSPEGYKIESVGPKYMYGKGKADMEKTLDVLKAERTGGCPFAFAR